MRNCINTCESVCDLMIQEDAVVWDSLVWSCRLWPSRAYRRLPCCRGYVDCALLGIATFGRGTPPPALHFCWGSGDGRKEEKHGIDEGNLRTKAGRISLFFSRGTSQDKKKRIAWWFMDSAQSLSYRNTMNMVPSHLLNKAFYTTPCWQTLRNSVRIDTEEWTAQFQQSQQ